MCWTRILTENLDKMMGRANNTFMRVILQVLDTHQNFLEHIVIPTQSTRLVYNMTGYQYDFSSQQSLVAQLLHTLLRDKDEKR